jgi:two-component system cell cycle response regulator
MDASRQRVLIVDDSRMVRATIAKLIRNTFDVREEPDGEAGWTAIESDRAIVAVISDLSMPKLDGFGLLERIRSSTVPRIRDVPVIMISGNEDDTTKGKARKAGANDFITKSTDGVEILARIDNLMRLVQAKHDLEASRQALKLDGANELWDPLTGTFTRDYLLTEGAKHFEHAQRHGSALSIISFRIENFLEITQRMGSDLGGQLLARIAKMVQSTLRAEDSIGRAEDTLFSIVTPSTAASQALIFARRLRDQLDNARVRHQDQLIKIRAAIGIASLGHDTASSIEELMILALQRLDRASRSAGSKQLDAKDDISVTIPPVIPSDIERAVQTLENASVDRTAEILKRLQPFLQAAYKRLNKPLPGEELSRALRAK